ncbi:hypothetical protein [Sabulibacter ruber]|uniref:hypothetical protein n=1 Tax=Sabulibacter ruber TaxID=2811901 RepID=UPI001A966F66|nr:hypothetical protein [Sabulibacter ruber]
MTAEQVRFDIVLKDLGSSPMAKFVQNMERQVKSITKLTGSLERSFAGTQKKISGLASSMAKMSSKKPLTNLNKGLQTTNGQLDRAISKMNKLANIAPKAPTLPTAPTAGAKGGSGGGSMVGGALKAAAGLFAVDKVFEFGKGVIDVTAKFEKYEAVLTNTFGSAERAKSSMQMLTDFAANTPFSVDQLTDSYVKLANRGFTPTMQQMTKMGDLASSVGKDFDQLVEAILDAEMGKNERIKEFGIKGKDNRDGTMTYTFKGQSKTIKKDAASIREYMLSLGDLKGVGGSMEAISKTLGGQLSNLGDNFMSLQRIIGGSSGGIFSYAISGANRLIGFFKELISKGNPVRQAFTGLYNAVAPMGQAIWGAMSSINLFNGEGTMAEKTINLVAGAVGAVTPVVSFLSGIVASAANFVATYKTQFQFLTATLLAGFAAYKIVGLIGSFIGVVRAATTATALVTKAQAAWNFVMNMNPIARVVTIIGALTGAVLVAWNKFEGFRGTIMGIWEVLKGFGSALTTDFGGSIMSMGRGIANFFGKLITPVFTMIEAIKSGEWMKAAKAGGQLLLNFTPAGFMAQATKSVTNAVTSSEAFKRGRDKAKNGGGILSMPDFFSKAQAVAATPAAPARAGGGNAKAVAAANRAAEDTAKVKSFAGEGATKGGLQMNIENLFNINTQRLLESMGKDGLAIRDVLTKELLAIVKDVEVSHGS